MKPASIQSRPPWSASCTTATDCTLHQLAPYIGRIKTSIAQFLIDKYSDPGSLVADPFCGCGVVPLEARLRGRRVVAGDVNPYGVVLTRAKLFAPVSEVSASHQLRLAWSTAKDRRRETDLRTIPRWVRSFFHPETLREALSLCDVLLERHHWFLLACLLGILHHQRPGFLSHPSSHLVPYLRTKLFPPKRFPELYAYRDVVTRMEKKVHRAYRRPPPKRLLDASVQLSDSRRLRLPSRIDAAITSPPYMNELDYVRDNRLRLWFLTRHLPEPEAYHRNRESRFRSLIASTMSRFAPRIARGGHIALVVGDVTRGGRSSDSRGVIEDVFRAEPALRSFDLVDVFRDRIPDIRRARRDLQGTKEEHVLVYRRG